MKNNIILAFILLLGAAVLSSAAITQISGLAVAQSSTKWNNVKDSSVGDNQTSGIMLVNPTVYDGTNFDRIRGDTTNGIDVDVTRVSGNITVIGANTPADDYTNPTDAINSFSLNAEFDGTTYDRVYHSFSQTATSVSANGAGTTLDLTATPMNKFTMIVDRTAGTTNAVEIDLECGINSARMVQIATITDLTTEPAIIAPSLNYTCNYIRYNVIDVGVGNTLTIDILATR
jgi:hypothetical protein